MTQAKTSFTKKTEINSATWKDIRRFRRGSREILEEKEMKCFVMHCEKYFQNSLFFFFFGPLTSEHGSPGAEPQGNYTRIQEVFEKLQFELGGPLNVWHPASTNGEMTWSDQHEDSQLESVTFLDSAAQIKGNKETCGSESTTLWKKDRREGDVRLFYIWLKFERHVSFFDRTKRILKKVLYITQVTQQKISERFHVYSWIDFWDLNSL